MAFLDAFLGGLSRDEDMGGLSALLQGKRRQSEMAPPTVQGTPGIGDGGDQGPDIIVDRPEPRQGMFGIKGTFRDILGTIGDALSEGTGGDAIYRKQRQNEKYADAIGGDLEDPTNAIDRLQQAGFGKEAQELFDAHQKRQLEIAKYGSEAAYKKAQLYEKGRANLGALLSTADARTFPALLEIAKRRAGSYGVEEGELPTTAEAAKTWGLDPYRRERVEDFDEAQELRERNVEDQIKDRSARRGLTARGQDIASSDRRYSTNAASSDRRRGQDMTDKRIRELKDRKRDRSRSESAAPTGGTGKYVLRDGKFVKQ